MDRLNLSSDEARTRLSAFLNERARNVQTSCNLGRVRRGELTVTATASNLNVILTSTPAGAEDPIVCIKPFTIRRADRLSPLTERTQDQLLTASVDPRSGQPDAYAVVRYGAVDCEIQLDRAPSTDLDLEVEGLLLGTDLVADSDVPAFPEDFHDVLVFGALADEYDHFDKPDLAAKQDAKFDRRVRELRYFIQKSIYLARVQNNGRGPAFWWSRP